MAAAKNQNLFGTDPGDLVLFKPTHRIMTAERLQSLLVSPGVSISVTSKGIPVFNDQQPVPLVETEHSVEMMVELNFENPNNVLEAKPEPGTFALLKASNADRNISFPLLAPKDEAAEEENAFVSYPIGLILGTYTETHAIQDSPLIRTFTSVRPGSDKTVKPSKYIEKLSNIISKCARYTANILNADNSTLVHEGQPDPNEAIAAAAAEGAEAAGIELPTPLPAGIPTVSMDKLNDWRAKRQEQMNGLREIFNDHTVVQTFPLADLPHLPELVKVIAKATNREDADSDQELLNVNNFLLNQIRSVIQSAVHKI